MSGESKRPVTYKEAFHALTDIVLDKERRERKLLERLLWALRGWMDDYTGPADEKALLKEIIEDNERLLAFMERKEFIDSAIYLGASDEELDALRGEPPDEAQT